ncbi:hypothetical protein BX666DRAFT_2029956 [Dichotomocladium elegans]|nr:hypothetical protein BX666DRAFT_2029956 [Dichotomocladium elegans]
MCHGRERLLEAHHARFSAAPPISSDVLASSMLLRAGYSGTPQHNQETRWTLESQVSRDEFEDIDRLDFKGYIRLEESYCSVPDEATEILLEDLSLCGGIVLIACVLDKEIGAVEMQYLTITVNIAQETKRAAAISKVFHDLASNAPAVYHAGKHALLAAPFVQRFNTRETLIH